MLVWLGRHELGLLVTVAALVFGVWMFILLADEVVEGGTAAIDRKILLSMRDPNNLADPVGPRFVEEAARDITSLGGMAVLCVLTTVIAGYLILDGKRHMALFVLGSVGTGLLAGNALKLLFNRPRPDLVPHAVYTVSTSFPSGHSMMAALTYLTLGALLARSEERNRVKAYFMIVAVVLTLAVGVTRVYLGVHWPTDVLAGWTAGAVWALGCWLTARWLQREHTIERESEDTTGPQTTDL